jgi:hypothetical protein
MQPKYSVEQTVRFTYKGKEYTGKIQGIKQGTSKTNGNLEPQYYVWVKDRGVWVTEGWILKVKEK